MATVTKPVALDESLNTTDSTPKNIADVLKDKLGDIASAISGGGGGSGGHTIQNASGANMPQETTMQFKDSHVTDNSQAGKTEVEVIKSVASADYSSETEDGLYLIPDGDGSVIEPASEDYVSVTADGVKTYGQLLNELYTLVDMSKVTVNSKLKNLNNVLVADTISQSVIKFVWNSIYSQKGILQEYILSSNSSLLQWYNNSYTDVSASAPASGTKITLYYGNKKAVVDLQTTANRCWYDSNNTVKQKIDQLTDDIIIVTDTVSLGALSSGASGYKEASIQIPAGYTSIMATVNHTSPSVLGGDLLLNVSVGGSTAYIMYRTFASISSANSTVRVRVLCKKS